MDITWHVCNWDPGTIPKLAAYRQPCNEASSVCAGRCDQSLLRYQWREGSLRKDSQFTIYTGYQEYGCHL